MSTTEQTIDNPVAIPARLSPSALDRFRTCPRSFRLHDVDRSPRQERSNPSFVQGSAVHHALERFFGLPVEDRSTDSMHQALRWAWPQHRKPDSFSSRDQEADVGRGALAMLSEFVDNFETSATPVAREQWVSAHVAGCDVYGKVDRVDRRGEGLEVIDYKTGRHRLESEDLHQDSAVQVYVLGTESRFGLPVERVRIIYLAHGDEVIWEPEREDVELITARLGELIGRLRAETEWEPNPGPQCKWCPVALSCDARDRVALADLAVSEGVPF